MQSTLRNACRRLVQRPSVTQQFRHQLVSGEPLLSQQHYSSSSYASKFAVVHHGAAYEACMQGPHGRQLALAQLEGEGKDDPPYDPFLEDELMEEGDSDEESGDEDIEDDEEEDADHDDDEADYDDSDDDNPLSIYNNDGSLKRNKSEKAVLRAGAPSGGLFAIIELAGTQHKVTTDDLLIVNRLKPLDTFTIGSIHTLEDVLLVGSSHLTLVGMPRVLGSKVVVMVEEITKDAKVIIFKKRRRKTYRRKTGFRREITMLRVLDICMPEPYQNHKHNDRQPPAALKSGEMQPKVA